MFYSRKPSKALLPYIDYIWYCKEEISSARQVLVIPFSRMEMVINLSGSYLVDGCEQKECYGWIAGHQTKPYPTAVGGFHECIGVVFTITGLNACTQLPLSAFLNSFVPVNEVWENTDQVIEQLVDAQGGEEKCFFLESFLLNKLVENKTSALTKNALILLGKDLNSRSRVSEMAKQLNTTRKSLNIHFNRHLGITLSEYMQQLLFNRLLVHLVRIKEERLIETAYEFDFFDQAHFSKQFRSFTGMSPKEYKQLHREEKISKEQPNFILV